MRIAILADIHGNLAALKAVMVELERVQPDYVVVNGDLILGIPYSVEVVELVRRQNWIVVRGNHEFYYLNFGTPRAVNGSDDVARWGQLHWLVERITIEQGVYLGMLPDEYTFCVPGTQPFGVAHGVPGRNRVGFYPDQAAASIAAELAHVQTATFISAHSHVQVDRQISGHMDGHISGAAHNGNGEILKPRQNGAHAAEPSRPSVERRWHLINSGSVGLPLNGDPSAQFAIIESVPEDEVAGGWRATHLRVKYDRRPSLDAFASTGLAEAGGVISRLFYWELVTAEEEIIHYFRWARANGYDPENKMADTFRIYCQSTARDKFVRARDPLYQRQPH
jgi:predicted phosphodiesterase